MNVRVNLSGIFLSRVKRNKEAEVVFQRVLGILSADPFNRSRTFKIKKLTDIPIGDGQWRIRVGNFRIRYDILGRVVLLYSFKDRRDEYR